MLISVCFYVFYIDLFSTTLTLIMQMRLQLRVKKNPFQLTLRAINDFFLIKTHAVSNNMDFHPTSLPRPDSIKRLCAYRRIKGHKLIKRNPHTHALAVRIKKGVGFECSRNTKHCRQTLFVSRSIGLGTKLTTTMMYNY